MSGSGIAEKGTNRGGNNMRISLRTRNAHALTLAFALSLLHAVPAFSASASSQVIFRELRSEKLAHNKVDLDPVRKMLVYLPAGYDESSTQRYPVIYFLPNAKQPNPDHGCIAAANSP